MIHGKFARKDDAAAFYQRGHNPNDEAEHLQRRLACLARRDKQRLVYGRTGDGQHILGPGQARHQRRPEQGPRERLKA